MSDLTLQKYISILLAESLSIIFVLKVWQEPLACYPISFSQYFITQIWVVLLDCSDYGQCILVVGFFNFYKNVRQNCLHMNDAWVFFFILEIILIKWFCNVRFDIELLAWSFLNDNFLAESRSWFVPNGSLNLFFFYVLLHSYGASLIWFL